MKAFEPDLNHSKIEAYLSRFLEKPVEWVGAEQLQQSTRLAPWRLDVRVNCEPRSYVLQTDPDGLEFEYNMLKAMDSIPLPTPRPYGLDLAGEALDLPCFFSDFIEGDSFLAPMQAGEPWAEKLYIDTVCALQSLSPEDLGAVAHDLERIPIDSILEKAYADSRERGKPLAKEAYQKLVSTRPVLPELCFSNGDLWLDNFLFSDNKLAGIIDFRNAAFSDPVYEFLLSFFASPELQGRGTEERFCQRIGVDPNLLHWYHGLEFFETWSWTLRSGQGFAHHTTASLEKDLRKWLSDFKG
jgi:aminoglycoside phosphotransferase (APT) family kinase protein